MKFNTRNKPKQNTMKHINILLSVGLLLLLSNCGSNWDLLNQAAETEEQSSQKGGGFTHRQQTPEGAELIFSYEAGNGLQAHYQTSTMPTPQAVSEYPVLHDAAGSPMRMSKLEQEEAYLLTTAGRWEVSEAGVLRYRGMRGEGGMIPGGYPGSGASSASSSGVPAGPYTTSDITYDEVQEVQKQYLRCPVEGYELATVERIASPKLQRLYDDQVDVLYERQWNRKFDPTWEGEANAEARRKVAKRLADYVTSYGLTKDPAGVKELKLWHGTDPGAAAGIMRTGYANLATTDDGYFGNGLYFTPQAAYAHRVYGKGILLLNKVSFYSAYPVAMYTDMEYLEGGSNYANYDAHFVPVQPADPGDPLTKEYYPAEEAAPTYDELVVFQQSQALPIYKVTLQPGLTRSPALLDAFRTQDILPITAAKLSNPGKVLTLEESLAVISNCLDIGEERAKAAIDKELVMFIGNTGAGKSTSINYLAGCTMERISKKKAGLEGIGKIVRVKEGSLMPELMKIGHSNISETFLPDIRGDGTFTYCDCPGFLDNRGAEINIANAVNVKRAIGLASSVKVNVLVNYNTLLTDRGRGISETRRIMSDLFGNEERLRDKLGSVLIGVTQVPPPRDGEDSEDQMEVGQLRAEFKSDKLLYSNAERIITFDPCEKPIEGGLKREEWIDQIKGLPGIEEPSEIFGSVLMLSDERKLREIAKEINERIKTSLESKSYEKVKEYLLTFNKLDRIGHDYVKGLKGESTQNIINKIHNTRHQITLFTMQDNPDFESSEVLLSELEQMKESLSNLPSCEFVESGYKEAKRYVAYSRKKYEEQQEQLKKLAVMQDAQEKLQAEVKQMEEREKEAKKQQSKLAAELRRTEEAHKKQEEELRQEKERALAKLRKEAEHATEEQKRELEKERKKQEGEYAQRQKELEVKQQELERTQAQALSKAAEQEKKLLKEKESLSKREEQLKLETQAAKGSQKLTELKRILGKHYLGESAWSKLGIEVKETDLPVVSEELLSKVKAMQTRGEEPMLVLDLGKSIGELEEKCKSKGKRLLSTRYGGDAKLRSESCYKETGEGIRWLLLPGSDHGVLPGSRSKSYDNQVKHMREHYPGYEVGGARELVTLYVLHHMETGVYLFPEDPRTWVRCKEEYQVGGWKGYRIALGYSGLGGLVVPYGGVVDHYSVGLFGFLSVSS